MALHVGRRAEIDTQRHCALSCLKTHMLQLCTAFKAGVRPVALQTWWWLVRKKQSMTRTNLSTVSC